MRRNTVSTIWCGLPRRIASPPRAAINGIRHIQIEATPSSTSPPTGSGPTSSAPDARFEVLGSVSSLLSISLSASQPLFTRRGSLVSVSGKPEHAVSTLSVLPPFIRGVSGVPFLYQKITSTSPLTMLISSRTPSSTFAVVCLDGRQDWTVAQRNGLLAWTGSSLAIKPRLRIGQNLGISQWGQSLVTGRGLFAVAGRGQIYQVSIGDREEYIVHPSNVLAYTTQSPPSPYRLRSHTLHLSIPGFSSLTSWLGQKRFVQELRKTSFYNLVTRFSFTVRTWARRAIWGDRLFIHFRGPATLLVQSRGMGIRESLSNRDVDEIADAPAGKLHQALSTVRSSDSSSSSLSTKQGQSSRISAETEDGRGTMPMKSPGRTTEVKLEGIPLSSTPPSEKQSTPTKLAYATVRSGKVEMRSSSSTT